MTHQPVGRCNKYQSDNLVKSSLGDWTSVTVSHSQILKLDFLDHVSRPTGTPGTQTLALF